MDRYLDEIYYIIKNKEDVNNEDFLPYNEFINNFNQMYSAKFIEDKYQIELNIKKSEYISIDELVSIMLLKYNRRIVIDVDFDKFSKISNKFSLSDEQKEIYICHMLSYDENLNRDDIKNILNMIKKMKNSPIYLKKDYNNLPKLFEYKNDIGLKSSKIWKFIIDRIDNTNENVRILENFVSEDMAYSLLSDHDIIVNFTDYCNMKGFKLNTVNVFNDIAILVIISNKDIDMLEYVLKLIPLPLNYTVDDDNELDMSDIDLDIIEILAKDDNFKEYFKLHRHIFRLNLTNEAFDYAFDFIGINLN